MEYLGRDDKLWMCVNCGSQHKFYYDDDDDDKEEDITLSTRKKLNEKMKKLPVLQLICSIVN